jgi:hypothetical protein
LPEAIFGGGQGSTKLIKKSRYYSQTPDLTEPRKALTTREQSWSSTVLKFKTVLWIRIRMFLDLLNPDFYL